MAFHGNSRYVYIAEPTSIRRFDSVSGMVSTVASGLTYAQGVWTDGAFAYISDKSAIRRLDLGTGELRTIAGSLTEAGSADGTGSEARFNSLGSLWGDGSNLYIIDQYSAIRKLDLATGNVTTLFRRGTFRGIWGKAATFTYAIPGLFES